jgi:hypothetical protein
MLWKIVQASLLAAAGCNLNVFNPTILFTFAQAKMQYC